MSESIRFYSSLIAGSLRCEKKKKFLFIHMSISWHREFQICPRLGHYRELLKLWNQTTPKNNYDIARFIHFIVLLFPSVCTHSFLLILKLFSLFFYHHHLLSFSVPLHTLTHNPTKPQSYMIHEWQWINLNLDLLSSSSFAPNPLASIYWVDLSGFRAWFSSFMTIYKLNGMEIFYFECLK